jgi:type I restriction enzyme, S subunit
MTKIESQTINKATWGLMAIPDDWRCLSIREFAKVTTGGTPSRKESLYWDGRVPWVTTSLIDFNVIDEVEEYITSEGVANSSAKVFPRGTLLMAMFGQGVTRGKVAMLGIDAAFNQACVAICPVDSVDSIYLYHFCENQYEAIRDLSNSGSQENLNSALIKSIRVPLPPLPEQRAIAMVLSAWDRGIRQTTDLIAAKRRLKQGLMQQLLTGKRRFPGFTDPLRKLPLRDVTEECSERNRLGLGNESVMAVTKAEGIVPMRERLIGAEVERYKQVRKDWFAYNPMRINIGSIARSHCDDTILVSPDYVVFRCREETADQPGIDPDYLDHLRESDRWSSFVTSSGNGSVRVRIYYADLGVMQLQLPRIAEQRKIATLLNALDSEISLLDRQLASLKTQKKGLMRKLLTGAVRVKVPS